MDLKLTEAMSYADSSKVASGTEQRRAALLLSGDVTTSDMTQEERIEEFQKLSRYHIPMDWQLPIEVVDIDLEKSAYCPQVSHRTHILSKTIP